MVGFFSLLLIASCVGIWYYIKVKPDPHNRKIAVGIALISFALVGITSQREKEEQAIETVSTAEIVEKAESSSTEPVVVELKLDSEELEVDKEGNAVITGTTNSGASVSVGAETDGDSVEADKDGKFSLNYSLSGDEDTELTVHSKLDDSQASAKITIKPNAKVLAQKKEEEKAAQEAAASKEKEEAEAAAAAEAESEAKAAESLKQQPVESEQPQQEYAETEYVDANGNGLIKGSNNGIYHIPGSKYYDRTTNPAAWFKTVSEAEAAGYRAPIK